jgi:hypothetical protein
MTGGGVSTNDDSNSAAYPNSVDDPAFYMDWVANERTAVAGVS